MRLAVLLQAAARGLGGPPGPGGGAGYTLVDVYVPWNFHETAPGGWDFTGRRDVGEFLDLARDAGLGVIARPGPYICSEWDGGALPAWLTLEDGLALRQAEPRYLRT